MRERFPMCCIWQHARGRAGSCALLSDRKGRVSVRYPALGILMRMTRRGKQSRGASSWLRPFDVLRTRNANTWVSSQPKERLIFVDDLEVWVLEKRIKNRYLRVQPPDGRIEVSVPYGTPDSVAEDMVRERRTWIEKRQREVAASPMAQATAATPAQVREWRAVVESCVPALVEIWAPILGVQVGSLAYRNMKTRWGSCQPSTGRICINVRLALYPPECLEYVVVHELCHLLVHGHGAAFHDLMDRVMPDWRKRRAKLR